MQCKLVLVVDDQAGIRALLSEVISQLGYQVATAAGGSAALDWLVGHSPDLILLDMNMPGMSGLETLQALRQRSVQAPVLMITADEHDQYLRQAEQLGAIGRVTKPFELTDFCHQIESVLGQA